MSLSAGFRCLGKKSLAKKIGKIDFLGFLSVKNSKNWTKFLADRINLKDIYEINGWNCLIVRRSIFSENGCFC